MRLANPNRAIRAAILSATAALSVGAVARADILYLAIDKGSGYAGAPDGGWWYDTANWQNSSTSTSPNPPPASGDTANINSNTAGVLPTLGVVYDPAHDPNAAGATSTSFASLYISSSSSQQMSAGAQPNTLTLDSGVMEPTSQVVVGRDATGKLVVNGGSLWDDGTFAVGGIHSNGNISGTLVYKGGLLAAGISSTGNYYAGSSGGLRVGLGTMNTGPISVGTVAIYNTGPTGAVNLESLFLGYGTYGTGVAEFHYGNGGIRPIQLTGVSTTSSGGQLALRNYSLTPTPGPTGGIGSMLNVVLDEAPALSSDVPPNEALITYTNGIHGISTNPKLFYDAPGTAIFNSTTDTVSYDTTGGSVGYANGGEVDAVFGDVVYRWDLYYDGLVTFTNNTTLGSDTYSPDSSVATISATGGAGGIGTESSGVGAVVLIGIGSYNMGATPEPASIGLLGGAAAMVLARRRKS